MRTMAEVLEGRGAPVWRWADDIAASQAEAEAMIRDYVLDHLIDEDLVPVTAPDGTAYAIEVRVRIRPLHKAVAHV